MQETSKYFRHDELLKVVRVEFERGLKRQNSSEFKGSLFSVMTPENWTGE
jgi:hypothetical protein